MTEAELTKRTQQFALRVLQLAEALPNPRAADTIAHQIIRSGTSVAANDRALCRSKSRADFINKTSIVEQEADETAFWLELLADGPFLPHSRIQPLLTEAYELVAILVASRRTASRRT